MMSESSSNIQDRRTGAALGRLGRGLAVLFVAQLAFFAWTTSRRWADWAAAEQGGTAVTLSVALIAGQLLALAAVGITLWRLYLVATYRPIASVTDDDLPELTVIVPAYNEGEQVLKTLRSLVQSDYPRNKLRIVAVNDGSVDDTWRWMQQGAREFSDCVIALDCRENRGKRAALYEGFGRATGEVIVTVDSDSEVLPDTLRNLVSPLVRDARVGAVAGNVRVLNRDQGVIPAMLDVSFTYSFEFMRASQCRVDTVHCCPGALSAYRRSLVESCKDEWLAQTFCGRPAAIGEDRAMTNLVLRQGFLVRFQANAVVLTEVPTRTAQLCRMYLRWARSNVRETLVMASFVFTRFRRESALGARVNLVWSALALLLAPFLFLGIPGLLFQSPQVIGAVLLGVLLSAVLPAAVFSLSRGLRGAWWAFPYGVYNFLCLSWITPYALLTSHRSAWLTRQLPAASAVESSPVAAERPRRARAYGTP